MINNDKLTYYYQALNGKDPASVPTTIYSPKNYLLYPTQVDYLDGYYDRFLFKKLNGTVCLETDEKEFGKIDGNYYKSVKISWKISGLRNTEKTPSGETILGVSEYNESQIRIAENIIPEARSYLNNNLQFWRGR